MAAVDGAASPPTFWLELIRSAARLVASSPAPPCWLDTKADAESGARYGADDLVRGAGTIYSWIQGRGLEAAAGHAAFLLAGGDAGDAELAHALDAAARRALERVRAARAANGGHLFFFMSHEGAPFVLEEEEEEEKGGAGGSANRAGGSEPRRLRRRALPALAEASASSYSDLFGARGQLCAAIRLGDAPAAEDARAWLRRVGGDVLAGRFESDQQTLDPRNAQGRAPAGRASQAPLMIFVGAAAAWLELEDSADAFELGAAAALRVLDRHVARRGASEGTGAGAGADENAAGALPSPLFAALPDHSLVEFVNADSGAPWRSAGPLVAGAGEGEGEAVLCDPGHSLEFVGLAAKFLLAARARGRGGGGSGGGGGSAPLDALAAALPRLLKTSFSLGFRPGPGGIVKAVNLVSGATLNDDMPWWSLPETIRAAAGVKLLALRAAAPDADAVAAECDRVAAACAAALERFATRVPVAGAGAGALTLLVQMRGADGAVRRAIPATSDLDPGFHTGLTLIDAMRWFDESKHWPLSTRGGHVN